MAYNKIKFKSFYSLVCIASFGFGLVPFIDLALYGVGVNPLYFIRLWNFLGFHLGYITIGIIFQYILLSILVFWLSISVWRKEIRLNKNQPLSNRTKLFIALKSAGIILLGYIFINLIAFGQPIVIESVYMFNFGGFSLANPFIHPYWVLLIIYSLIILLPIFLGYVIAEILTNQRELSKNSKIFNQIPFFNLIIPVFFSFIVFYYELVPIFHIVYINRIFILFVGFFILISFLILFIIYLFNFQKKLWMETKFSVKLLILFIPFFIGYFLAGQSLNVTDIFFGMMIISALQIYAIYLKNSSDPKKPQLNWFIIFVCIVLAVCFGALLSITSLLLVVCNLIILFVAIYIYNERKWNIILYSLVGANILLVGGTSSTFLSNIFAIGIPNTLIFYAALIFLVVSLFIFIFKEKIIERSSE